MAKPKAASLYHIASDLREIMELVLNPDELESEELQELFMDRFGELEGELNDKVANCSFFYHELQSAIKARKEEEVRLRDERKAMENGLDRFKGYVGMAMDLAGRTEIVNEKGFGFKFAKSPASAEVVDQDKLDAWQNEHTEELATMGIEMVTMEWVVSFHKKSIMDYWKQTKQIPDGAVIHDDRKHLRVK